MSVNITTYMPSLGNFLMNNSRTIHPEKIATAPTLGFQMAHLKSAYRLHVKKTAVKPKLIE